MVRLKDCIANNEDWLIERVIKYAKEYNYVKYSSTLKEAFRTSVVGLSDTILKALEYSDQPPVLGPDLDYNNDPLGKFGILEARKHRARGVSLGMFLGGLVCYRQAYIDLVRRNGFGPDDEEHCRLFVERVFDRVEIAFCTEWTGTAPNDLIEVLQTTNRNITNEKNKYLTICESLPNPVIVFDENNQIDSMNYAAMALFEGNCTPGQYYYSKQSINIGILWLTDALNACAIGNYKNTIMEKQLVTKEATYSFEIRLKPLLDISEKFIGTIVILNDITGIKQAEKELRKRFEREKILSGISTGLINLAPEDINKEIYNALQLIGEYAGADRSYIVLFLDNRMIIDNTYEWCSHGVLPRICNLMGASVSKFDWLMRKFERFKTVNIPAVADLPPQAYTEIETFQAQDIKSLMLVPLVYDGELAGLAGFDSVFEESRWQQDVIAPLKIVGEMLINVIERNKFEKSARLAYKELNQIFTTTGDGMRVIDNNFNVVRINDALADLIGVSKEEAIGTKCYDLFFGPHCNTMDCPIFRIIGGDERIESDVLKERNDGVKIHCIITATPLKSTNGEIIGIVENFKDITERKLVEEALKKSEERFRLLAENAMDIVYRAQLYPIQKIEYISPAVSNITGYAPGDFYADPLMSRKVLHPADRSVWKSVVNGNFNYTRPVTVRWLRRDDGSIIWLEHRNVPIYDESNRLIALEGIARDVTDRKLIEEQLLYLSYHDSLTGLYNRAYFELEMQRLDDGCHHPMGIIICDVDDLKLINDSMGHSVGDQALVAAADMFKKSFRESDVVARIGGDEFAALLPDSDMKTMENIYSRINVAQMNKSLTSSAFNVSMSVGFAVSDARITSITDVFKQADNNMYREKYKRKKGRDCTASFPDRIN